MTEIQMLAEAKNKDHGFTLAELAIVLLIVGLLLAGALVPLSTQVEQRRISETQKTLEEIKEALIGFAIVNRRLPCPDTNNDGVADPATPGACPQLFGNVPWQTLGTPQFDAWGTPFRYQVTNVSSSAYTTAIMLPPAVASADLHVCASATSPAVTATTCGAGAAGTANTLIADAPAVFYSMGSNGTQWLSGGIIPASADEKENANLVSNTNLVFVNHVKTGAGSVSGEFDDIVSWLPPNILFSRMVAAGRLP